MWQRLVGMTRNFTRHCDGIAAVEFACVLPFFLILVLGGNELALASSASRKVATLTRTIADLTTQYSTMSETDVLSIFNASTQVLAPLPVTGVTIVLSEISVDNSGIATVTWSRALNTKRLVKGNVVILPYGFKIPGTALILATVSYAYSPTFGASFMEPVTISDHLYMLPRRSSTVDLT